jgi:hypothetical protein
MRQDQPVGEGAWFLKVCCEAGAAEAWALGVGEGDLTHTVFVFTQPDNVNSSLFHHFEIQSICRQLHLPLRSSNNPVLSSKTLSRDGWSESRTNLRFWPRLRTTSESNSDHRRHLHSTISTLQDTLALRLILYMREQWLVNVA